MRVGVSLRKLEDLPPEVRTQSGHWNPKDPLIPGVFIRGGLQRQGHFDWLNNAYQYYIQWEGETKFGEGFQYSPEELEWSIVSKSLRGTPRL